MYSVHTYNWHTIWIWYIFIIYLQIVLFTTLHPWILKICSDVHHPQKCYKDISLCSSIFQEVEGLVMSGKGVRNGGKVGWSLEITSLVNSGRDSCRWMGTWRLATASMSGRCKNGDTYEDENFALRWRSELYYIYIYIIQCTWICSKLVEMIVPKSHLKIKWQCAASSASSGTCLMEVFHYSLLYPHVIQQSRLEN